MNTVWILALMTCSILQVGPHNPGYALAANRCVWDQARVYMDEAACRKDLPHPLNVLVIPRSAAETWRAAECLRAEIPLAPAK